LKDIEIEDDEFDRWFDTWEEVLYEWDEEKKESQHFKTWFGF